MSVLNCIAKLSKVKKLSKKTEQEILDFLTNDQRLDLDSASITQQINGVDVLLAKKARAKAQAVKQALATAKAEDFVFAHPKGPVEGWKKLMDDTFVRATSLRAYAGARMGRWIDEIGAKWIGFGDDIAAQEDALRIAHGGRPHGNNPAAQGFADAARDVGEEFRKAMIEAGSPVAFRADYGSPHVYRHAPIKAVTLDEFLNATRPRLDYSRIYTQDGRLMTPTQVDFVLKNIWDDARTNGASRLTPGAQGGRSMANQWGDHRILAYTPEGIVEHNRQFGESNVIKLYMSHFEAMSHDLAMMQKMGPNPTSTKNYITDTIAMKTGKRGDAEGMSKWMWNVVSGVTNEGVDTRLARWSQAFRNILSSALLPSAAIRSLTGDIATTARVAQLRGMSTLRILDYYKTLMMQRKVDRGFAARLLASSEMFLNELHGAHRMGDVTLDGITGKLTDKLFRLSTLTPQTHALKAATSMDFLQMLALNVGKAFDDLPVEMRGMFREYGFEPNHWDVLRKAPVIRGSNHFAGAQFLDLMNLPQLTDAELIAFGMKRDGVNDVFRRITDMMTTEVDTMAVPTPGLRTRAVMTMGQRADSPLGQGWRMVMLFKSFPVAYMFGHLERGMAQPGFLGKAAYFGKLGAYTTIAGAIGNQAIDILKGNDPENMFTGKFWGKAFLAGGGGGLMTDFIQSGVMGQNRYSHGFLTTALGPSAQWASDTASLLLGTGFDVIRGDDVNVANRLGKAVEMARTYSPKLFYSRLAMDRLIWDRLKQAADPHAHGAWRRNQRRMMKEREVEPWWRSGDLSPERSPNLGAAFGEQ